MKKIVAASAAAVMTATVLAGCGGGGSSSSSGGYCDDIKAAKANLDQMGTSFTADKFTAVNAAVHSISGEAPAEIKAQWVLVATQFDKLKQDLKDAGVSMDDFSKLASGGATPSIDPSKLAALETKLKSFDTSGLNAATNKIHDEVKKTCNIDLGSSSGN